VVVACRSDNVSPTVTEPPLINFLTPGQAAAASSNNIVRHNESFANDFGIQVNASLNNVVFENETHDNPKYRHAQLIGEQKSRASETRSNQRPRFAPQGINSARAVTVHLSNRRP